jgi:hypothetical protein
VAWTEQILEAIDVCLNQGLDAFTTGAFVRAAPIDN